MVQISAQSQGKPTELKIVLLGKTGAGKSASGNTILGREAFVSKKSSRSITREVCREESCVGGIKVVVYDTPGFFDTECPEKEITQTCQEVIEKCKSGPCLFLVVVKIDRFTPEEKRAVDEAVQLLDEQQLKQSWILFTRGDELEGQTIEEFIHETDDLREAVERFENRYHVFNNKDRHSENQVQQLLNKAITGFQNRSDGGDDDFSDVVRHIEIPAHTDELLDRETVPPEKTSVGESATDVNRLSDHPACTDNLPERRIVLLGKSGVGKSASGNTILGREAFQSELGLSSVTSECKKEVSVVSGQHVSVIDTPGFFDTETPQEDLAVKIGRSIYLSQPGAHAFLFVLRLERFTEQEENVIKAMEAALSPGVKDHTIILFTHGEKLNQINMEHEIKKNPKLRNVMEKFGGRYHIFSNNEKTNRVQVTELMEKIDRMLEKNNGKCFTCEMYEAAKRAAEEQRIRERRQAVQRAAEEQRIRERDQAVQRAAEEKRIRKRCPAVQRAAEEQRVRKRCPAAEEEGSRQCQTAQGANNETDTGPASQTPPGDANESGFWAFLSENWGKLLLAAVIGAAVGGVGGAVVVCKLAAGAGGGAVAAGVGAGAALGAVTAAAGAGVWLYSQENKQKQN